MPVPLSYLGATAVLLGIVVAPQIAARSQTAPKPTTLTNAQKTAFFDKQVWPILKANCVSCHGGSEPSGGLNLMTREAALKGGASGATIIPGDAKTSLLTRAVHFDGREMPPQGKLPRAQIETLTRWVAMGAPWGGANASAAAPAKHGPPPVNAENMRFWSFQKVKRPPIPKTKNAAWASRSPIDAFILAKLEKNGLAPAPPASRAALLRRVYYDLTGLPPTPDETRRFLADKSPGAYAQVVDRLLASPQYGERWGRHWLDLVRYGETNSFERDGDKPFVWRYRDYVIRAFNDDKPYDRFVTEQLAGDEMPGATPETLIATGYYRLGTWDDEPVDREQAVFDDLDDVVSTTAQTFMGLAVGCARCHDSKIDPIPTKDYYQMTAFFRNVNRYGERDNESVARASLRPISSLDEQKRFAEESGSYKARLDALTAQIKTVEATIKPDLGGGEIDDFKIEANRVMLARKRVPKLLTETAFADYERLFKERTALRASPPKGLEQALCVTEAGPTAPKTFVLGRGSVHAPEAEVEPGFPSVLAPPAPRIRPTATTTGRRLALAEWIGRTDNPLTARVLANRVWQFHFGRGIVRSSSNFGFLGNAPTHPELLDYLASELTRNGWRLKPLHRQIVLSNAYQMSSRPSAKARAKDPENDLFSHFDMRRLDAEEVRDSVLAATGTLNKKMFGPSVFVTIPPEVLAGQSQPGAGWGQSPPDEQARRSVYVKVKRSLAVPMLAQFDTPETDATCPVRFATSQPTQALGMMNSAFMQEQARTFAAFVRKNKPNRSFGKNDLATDAQVRFALWRVLQRAPTDKEAARGVALIAELRKDGASEDDALAAFCLVALNLNEFIYLD